VVEGKGGEGRKTGRVLKVILGILLVLCVNFSVRLVHLPEWQKGQKLFYAAPSHPLMTTQDAYYYLRLADDYLKGDFGGRDLLSPISKKPYPFSLLSLVAAGVSRFTGVPLEMVAFYMPVFMSSLMVLVYLGWGIALMDMRLFVVSGLIGSVVFYWYTRTCFGRFDTDSLIPFFVYIIPYCLFRFCVDKRWQSRSAFAVLAVILSSLFYCWWLPARYLLFPLLFITYAVSVFFVPSSRFEKYLKIGILVVVAIGVTTLLLAYFSIIPRSGWIGHVMGYVELVTHRGKSSLPSVASSISELIPIGYKGLVGKIAGNAVMLVASLVGLGWLVMTRFSRFAFLGVPFLLAGASLFSRRFLIFLTPLFALGLGFFICKIVDFLPQRKGDLWRRSSLIAAVVLCLCMVGDRAWNTFIPPRNLSYHAWVASSVRNSSGSSELMWSWWDYGYFLEYYSEKRAFVDGGSQDGLRIFLAAFPLTAGNDDLSASWIRCFALNGPHFFWSVAKTFGSTEKAINFLADAFQSPSELSNLLKKYGVNSQPPWLRRLFPAGRVYLYLPFEMLGTAYWWYYYGTWNFATQSGKHVVGMVLPSNLPIDRNNGLLNIRGKSFPLKHIMTYAIKPEPSLFLVKSFEKPSGYTLVLGKLGSFLVDNNLEQSTFFRLLFAPKSSPRFHLIRYVPHYAGMWEVLPVR